jgi:predicted Zn finger-like uncharacterized protein
VKISCPSCAAKYSITDEKVRDRLAKIRCRKCGTTIVIDGKVDPPAVTAAAATATSTEASADTGYGADPGYGGATETGPLPGDYSVDMGDDDQRSMSVQQIVDAYHSGEISDMTYVWADGMIDWQRVADVAELANAIGLNTGYAPPESQPLSSRAATRSGVGRGSAADLFGGIESAGSEEDVTTSAPEPIAAPAPTGARNESSVLFSLSALTGSATPTAPIAVPNPSFPPKVSTTAAASEDSGLIDLKALTATVPGAASDVMMAPVSPLLGAPPLGVSAPLGGVGAVPTTADVDMGRGRSSSKSGLFIGGAIVVVGLAAVLAFVTRGSEEPKPEPTTVVAPAAPTAARPAETARPTPPPVKTAEATAEPPPTGTVAAAEPPPSAKPSATPPATAARAITGSAAPAKRKPTPATSSASSSSSTTSSSSSSGSSSSASSSAPAAAPAEPKSTKKKCDCKPSDLMCAMKCSAK